MHFDRFFDSLWNKLRRRKPMSVYFCCRLWWCHTYYLLVISTRPVASPPQVPWDDWDLDPIFFSALSRWTRKHPESSLDHIFDNICVGIDMGNDLLQIIPNSPFPARGLIGALAHLVKLGVVCVSNYSHRGWSQSQTCLDYSEGYQRCSGVREGHCTLGWRGENSVWARRGRAFHNENTKDLPGGNAVFIRFTVWQKIIYWRHCRMHSALIEEICIWATARLVCQI